LGVDCCRGGFVFCVDNGCWRFFRFDFVCLLLLAPEPMSDFEYRNFNKYDYDAHLMFYQCLAKKIRMKKKLNLKYALFLDGNQGEYYGFIIFIR
jgi:hypothetical protein